MLFLLVIALIIGFSVWYWVLRDERDIRDSEAEFKQDLHEIVDDL
jgi:hypothetical protein